MATRDDVARLAGVSSSTVSYVISGRRPISQATRERVRRAMRDLDYTPNAVAQALAGARKGIVALHYPPSHHGLDSTQFEYVSAAAERGRERGYHTLLWSNPIDDVDGLRSLVSQQLVDGVILMEVLPVDPRIPILQSSPIPFVAIGRPDHVNEIAYVDNDFDSMARQVIDHLADLGHTHALFLSPLGLASINRAIEQHARRRGVRLEYAPNNATLRAGYEGFTYLSALEEPPTAVFSYSEMTTLGLLHAAALAGASIPDRLTVVGLAVDGVAAEMFIPSLTTVSPPSRQIATVAMDTLADAIDGTATKIPQVLLAPTLTVRGSSAPPARTPG